MRMQNRERRGTVSSLAIFMLWISQSPAHALALRRTTSAKLEQTRQVNNPKNQQEKVVIVGGMVFSNNV